jgi:hypothetical protein
MNALSFIIFESTQIFLRFQKAVRKYPKRFKTIPILWEKGRSFFEFLQVLKSLYIQREYNEEEPARTKKITPSISDLLKKLIVVLVNKNVLTQTRKKNARKKRHKTDLSQIFFFGSLEKNLVSIFITEHNFEFLDFWIFGIGLMSIW